MKRHFTVSSSEIVHIWISPDRSNCVSLARVDNEKITYGMRSTSCALVPPLQSYLICSCQRLLQRWAWAWTLHLVDFHESLRRHAAQDRSSCIQASRWVYNPRAAQLEQLQHRFIYDKMSCFSGNALPKCEGVAAAAAVSSSYFPSHWFFAVFLLPRGSTTSSRSVGHNHLFREVVHSS